MTAFTSVRRTAPGALTIIAGALLVAPGQAQNYPISSSQRATAQQVSERECAWKSWPPTPRHLHRQAGRHALGHFGHVPQAPWRWPELGA